MKKPSFQDYSLYLVTDPHLHRGYSVLEQVELALKGGVKIIQIREKNLPVQEYTRIASDALKLTQSHNAFLIINDAVEVVKAIGADGLHLGQDDMPLTEARAILGHNVIIGISVKTVEEARKAERDGADYLAVNGVFPTQTKVDLGYCPGLEGVSAISRCTHLPIVGIGGINLNNCRSVVQAGANGIAVVTAITMSDNIPETCRSFFELLSSPYPGEKESENARG
jgi:thiamine-phosphate pyrophosphorylase